MEQKLFSNEVMISWIQYFTQNVDFCLAKLRMLDITGRNKNLIPTVMCNRAVLVFTDAGHPDIFYDMWTAELGDCEIWYNEGSDPSGEIKHHKVSEMINRGINASAAMLIMNPDARTNHQVGIENSRFSCGSVHYVCQEVRAVIMNKLNLGDRDNIIIISGESIAVEAAIIAAEGSIIAVEYDPRDRDTMQENVDKFGLNNVTIIEKLDKGDLEKLPVPDIAFIVATPRVCEEVQTLLTINPLMNFVLYTLDFDVLSSISRLFQENGIERAEAIHVHVSRVNSKHMMEPFPAPWIISGRRPT